MATPNGAKEMQQYSAAARFNQSILHNVLSGASALGMPIAIEQVRAPGSSFSLVVVPSSLSSLSGTPNLPSVSCNGKEARRLRGSLQAVNVGGSGMLIGKSRAAALSMDPA